MLHTRLHLLFFKSHYLSPLKFSEAKRRPVYCQNLAVGSQVIERQSSISSTIYETGIHATDISANVPSEMLSSLVLHKVTQLHYLEQIKNKVLMFAVIQNPWVYFCKSMMLRIAVWPSSSFANYILPEYIPPSLSLDKVLFSFSLFPPETVWCS